MRSRARLLLALAAMVAVPLGGVGAVAARLVEREERLVRQRFADLALAQLQDLRQGVRAVVAERESRALTIVPLLQAERDPAEQLRGYVRREPLWKAALLLDADGRILFPPAERTRQEELFLGRARALVRDPGALLSEVSASAGEQGPSYASRSVTTRASSRGWHVWYDDADLDLLFWQRLPDGRIAGLELDRARLLADLIARLPEDAGAERGFVLSDARGAVLHRWGGHAPAPGAPPLATLALDPPLASWRLDVHAKPALASLSVGLWSGLALGIAALGLSLAGLAAYLYLEHERGLRLAEQRVSFVNRVSHELKTPLTNIRLYAELLAERLGDEDEDARRQLDVVVSEGQRLSRLVDNVLTFGRHQRGALRLRFALESVDEVVLRVAGRWREALQAKGVCLVVRPAAPGRVELDADALTQVLDNLLGNVEKYAAAGGSVSIETSRDGDGTTIVVSDRGPGIPRAARERVFEPFQRLGDATSEGASGTGIGLAVVRELARLHGGDARVRDGSPGAVFEVTLRTPVAGGRS